MPRYSTKKKRSAPKSQVSRSWPIPASTKGWVANQAITKMDPEAAVILDNWFPRPDAIQWRRGTQLLANLAAETTAVETVLVWQGGAAQRIFGCCNGKIYTDASGGGTINTTVATGLSSNRWQQCQFSTAGGQFLLAVNGADAYRQYDGTTWTTTAVTGPAAPNALINLFAFKQRLFFIEQNTADVWYLPVNAISGALTKIPLGPLLRLGGSIMAGATWTHDTGASGPQDYAVFLSTEGECLIYGGNDPGSASTWGLIGKFFIGRPIGRRCFLNVGADLVVLCSDGLMPLSKAIQFDRAAAAKAAFTWNIQQAFADAYQAYSSNFGWQIISFVGSNMALINVPVAAGTTSYQFVMNVLTGAWCRYKGIDASCFSVMRDGLYLGRVDGKIYQAETGSADGSVAIQADWVSAYNDLGTKGKSKSCRMARPVFITDPQITPAVGVCVDYNTQLPTNIAAPAGGSASAIAKWDVAVWDVDKWPITTNVVQNWLGIQGEGYQIAAAVSINISSSTPASNLDCKLTVMNILYEPGGFI